MHCKDVPAAGPPHNHNLRQRHWASASRSSIIATDASLCAAAARSGLLFGGCQARRMLRGLDAIANASRKECFQHGTKHGKLVTGIAGMDGTAPPGPGLQL